MVMNKSNIVRSEMTKGYKDLLAQLTSSMDFNEQRKTSRLPVEFTVSCWLQSDSKHEIVGITKDMSLGGCLLLVPREINIGSMVTLRISLGLEENMHVSGEIVRVHNTGSNIMEYGVAFKDLEKMEALKFEKFCFKRMYEDVGLKDWPTKNTNQVW